MKLDAGAFLLQWATGGLFFTWVTTRRREVSLGYGWLMRIVFGLMALGAFAVFLTDTSYSGGGSAQFLEVRHRGHACVEDRISCGKSTGFGRFPSRDFGVNTVWLELSLTAIDLLAWTRFLLLDGELATAEPKKLRYRLLHVAARLTRDVGLFLRR